MPQNNLIDLTPRHVATDVWAVLDGHVIEDYFGPGRDLGYAARQRPSGDGIDLDAIDADGNKHTFTLDVTDAG